MAELVSVSLGPEARSPPPPLDMKVISPSTENELLKLERENKPEKFT